MGKVERNAMEEMSSVKSDLDRPRMLLFNLSDR